MKAALSMPLQSQTRVRSRELHLVANSGFANHRRVTRRAGSDKPCPFPNRPFRDCAKFRGGSPVTAESTCPFWYRRLWISFLNL
jgi:hypothetical protein